MFEQLEATAKRYDELTQLLGDPVVLAEASERFLGSPVISPDGRWLGFASNETGEWQVFVQPADGSGSKFQVSSDGGRSPFWSQSGNTLFYTKESTRFEATLDLPRRRVESLEAIYTGDGRLTFYASLPGDTSFVARVRPQATDDRKLFMIRNFGVEVRELLGLNK